MTPFTVKLTVRCYSPAFLSSTSLDYCCPAIQAEQKRKQDLQEAEQRRKEDLQESENKRKEDLSLQLQRSSLQSPSSFSSFSSSSSSAASSSPPSASTQKAVPTHCPKSDHSFPFLNDDVSQECKCKSKIHNILIGCCTSNYICTHHM